MSHVHPPRVIVRRNAIARLLQALICVPLAVKLWGALRGAATEAELAAVVTPLFQAAVRGRMFKVLPGGGAGGGAGAVSEVGDDGTCRPAAAGSRVAAGSQGDCGVGARLGHAGGEEWPPPPPIPGGGGHENVRAAGGGSVAAVFDMFKLRRGRAGDAADASGGEAGERRPPLPSLLPVPGLQLQSSRESRPMVGLMGFRKAGTQAQDVANGSGLPTGRPVCEGVVEGGAQGSCGGPEVPRADGPAAGGAASAGAGWGMGALASLASQWQTQQKPPPPPLPPPQQQSAGLGRDRGGRAPPADDASANAPGQLPKSRLGLLLGGLKGGRAVAAATSTTTESPNAYYSMTHSGRSSTAERRAQAEKVAAVAEAAARAKVVQLEGGTLREVRGPAFAPLSPPPQIPLPRLLVCSTGLNTRVATRDGGDVLQELGRLVGASLLQAPPAWPPPPPPRPPSQTHAKMVATRAAQDADDKAGVLIDAIQV